MVFALTLKTDDDPALKTMTPALDARLPDARAAADQLGGYPGDSVLAQLC